MRKPRNVLLVLLTLVALTIGNAIAIEKALDAPEPNVSSQDLLDAARSAYDIHQALYTNVRGPTAEDLYIWSKRVMTADRDLNPAAGEQMKAVKAHLERMQKLEQMAKARLESARASAADVAAATYYRIEAELMLARKGD